MILIKNRLIFGLIKKIITGIFKFLYKIISVFNLQLAILVGLIGLVLYAVGVFESGGVALTVFSLVMIVAIVVAVLGTIKRALGLGKKVKRSKGAQIVNQEESHKQISEQTAYQPQNLAKPPIENNQINQPIAEQPTYYRVKQNSNYVMAEYSDRYELYKASGGQMIKVRTDYKKL